MLNDLEITKLCAEAMGWRHLGAVGMILPPDVKSPSDVDERFKGKLWCLNGGNDWWLDPEGHYVCGLCNSISDPLHDDAQAMALVKKFGLNQWYDGQNWRVVGGVSNEGDAWSADLNRAICECVAKMQKIKHGK